MSDDISLELFIKTALALWERPENEGLGEDDLFDATRAFLRRARVRHRGGGAVWWELAFIPPLVPWLKCAKRITKERTNEAALAAAAKFIRPEALKEYRKRGINADYCGYLREEYQRWRKAPDHRRG